MSSYNRLKTGTALTKDGLSVIRHHPTLGLFPLVGGVVGLSFLAVLLGVTFGLMAVAPDGGALVGLFLVYLALTFVSSFFTAGLVHQTRSALEGNEPSLRAGVVAAWERKRPLLVWALISATIGVVVNGLENADSRVAYVFGAVFGVAWTLMTFFVVPVIVFERASTGEMFSRSAETFKRTWGETPISLLAIQIVALAVLLPFALPGVYLYSVGFVLPAVALVLAGLLLSFLAAQTLQGVVRTTLYLYATTGMQPAEFDDVDFEELARGRVGGAPDRPGPVVDDVR